MLEKIKNLMMFHSILFCLIFGHLLTNACPLGDSQTSLQSTELSGNKKPLTLCYYTDWSPHRCGKAHFEPKNIDPALCTHVIYAFSLLDDDTLDKIVPEEPDLDVKNGYFGRVTALKKYGTKALIGIGGWVDSTPKYGVMLRNDDLRKKVVRQITEYVIRYKFDGIEISILYPAAYQGNITADAAQDKQYFLTFLRELRQNFDYRTNELHIDRLLLTTSAGADDKVIDAAYDVPGIIAVCDWVNLLTHDLHGEHDKSTRFVSPLAPQSDDSKFVGSVNYSVQKTVELWLRKGATPEKLVVGFASYGRTFALKDPKVNGINSPTEGKPDPAEYTGYVGWISYYEIIERIRKGGWTVVHKDKLGSYAFKDNQWMAFNDKVDAAAKAEYVRDNGFLGASLWSLELECFQVDCPVGRYPLLSTIRGVLTGDIDPKSVNNGV